MRASIVVLVAVIAVFTSSGLASASNPAQLQQTVPGATNKVENAEGGRFLREGLKDESDDLTSEERGFWADLTTKAKRAVKGEYLLARLFKKSYQQLEYRDVTPEYLWRAANTLEHAGWPAEKNEGIQRYSKGVHTLLYVRLVTLKSAEYTSKCIKRRQLEPFWLHPKATETRFTKFRDLYIRLLHLVVGSNDEPFPPLRYIPVLQNCSWLPVWNCCYVDNEYSVF